MDANKFIDMFGHLDIPKVIYDGIITEQLVEDIKNNTYRLDEGVIMNGIGKRKKGQEFNWKCKLKSLDWLKRVKEKMGQEFIDEDLGDSKIYSI